MTIWKSKWIQTQEKKYVGKNLLQLLLIKLVHIKLVLLRPLPLLWMTTTMVIWTCTLGIMMVKYGTIKILAVQPTPPLRVKKVLPTRSRVLLWEVRPLPLLWMTTTMVIWTCT